MSLKDLYASQKRGDKLIPILIEHLAKAKKDPAFSRKNFALADSKMTIECFKERMDEFNHGEDLGDDLMFHPSAIGMCQRQLFFQHFKALPNPHSVSDDLLRSYLTLELGTYVHVMFQNLCQHAGVLHKREVAIIDRKLKIVGHADGILKLGGEKYLLEIKTINDRGFTSLNAPKPEHKGQMTCYMKCLELNRGIIVYINKNTSLLKEFLVEHDEAYFKTSCQSRIRKYLTAIEEKALPDKEGVSPSAFPCSYCPYSRVCFDNTELSKFSSKLSPAKRQGMKLKRSV